MSATATETHSQCSFYDEQSPAVNRTPNLGHRRPHWSEADVHMCVHTDQVSNGVSRGKGDSQLFDMYRADSSWLGLCHNTTDTSNNTNAELKFYALHSYLSDYL